MNATTELNNTKLAGKLAGTDTWNTSKYPLDAKNNIEEAKKQGLEIVYPAPNELQLDIDNAASYDTFFSMYNMFNSFFPIKEWDESPSRSGNKNRRHVTIKLKNPVSDLERVLLQSILGSDPKREFLSYIRLLRGEENATLFFELPSKSVLDTDMSVDF